MVAMRATSTWMDEVKAHGVEAVARAFSVTVVGKGRSVGIACPACGVERRGRTDKRGACGLTPDGAGWKCHQCQATGTALDVAMLRQLGRKASGHADWESVHAACASHGLCEGATVGAQPRAVPVRPVPPPALREHGPHDGPWAPTVNHTPGHALRTWEAHVDHYLVPCGGCDACVDGDGQCSTKPPNPARAWLTDVRGFPADARLESGVVTATVALVATWPEHARGWVEGRLKTHGPALLAPMRNARTNVVEGMALRFLDSAAKPKCQTVAGLRHTADDGTPRGYGLAGACKSADLLVLVEGLTDTLAAEALLLGLPGAVAVGAIAADSMKHWAPILKERKHGHVVVVPDLDKPKGATVPTADGKGQDVATDLVRDLASAGVSAFIFTPGAMLKRLRAGGLPVVDGTLEALPRIKDLADMVHECAAANIPWATLRRAFHDTLKEVTRD